MMADLHVLEAANHADIPAMLRAMADIATVMPFKTAILVTVDPKGDVQTYGWGQTDARTAAGPDRATPPPSPE